MSFSGLDTCDRVACREYDENELAGAMGGRGGGLATQTTTSGAEDAGVLREAKAAADTSACTGTESPVFGPTPCPLHSWTADTEPCGDGYMYGTDWVGVVCDARGGRVPPRNPSNESCVSRTRDLSVRSSMPRMRLHTNASEASRSLKSSSLSNSRCCISTRHSI